MRHQFQSVIIGAIVRSGAEKPNSGCMWD